MLSKSSFAQTTSDDGSQKVTTAGIFESEETKSGYLINEYYVELTHEQFDTLKGKRVIVSGKLLVVKGIDPEAEVKVQGSTSDRLFILNPVIVYDTSKPGRKK